MSNLVQSLIEAGEKFPRKPAVVDPSRELTFGQLVSLAGVMRGIITRETECPRVGLMLPSSAVMVGSFYGALWAGRTAIPLNFMLGPKELAGVIADAGIDTIVTIEHFADALADLPVKALFLERLGLKSKVLRSKLGKRPAPPDIDANDLAVILYTSGTSGLPKGVCLTHANLDSNARGAIEHARMSHDQRFLGVIPPFHSFGLTGLLLIPVTLGATVYYLPRFSPLQVVRSIRENRISIFLAIPSMYTAISRLKSVPADAFESLSLAISGGEPLSEGTASAFRERFGLELHEGYGLTETSPILSINMPWANSRGSVGRALPGVEFRIAADEGHQMGTDEPGEILARGSGIMRGYYNKPEETRAVLDGEGWFRTGDIGTLDAEGFLRITGRKKEMIIVGGENVYPREVEDVLSRHAAVSESAVIGRRDASRGEVVVAYVILEDEHDATEMALRDHCREHLAGYKVPREIRIATELPRGPTGKILKRALADQA